MLAPNSDTNIDISVAVQLSIVSYVAYVGFTATARQNSVLQDKIQDKKSLEKPDRELKNLL